jgi:hypothetical protein
MYVYWLNMNRHKRAQKDTGMAHKWHKYGVSNLWTKMSTNQHKQAQKKTGTLPNAVPCLCLELVVCLYYYALLCMS